MQESSRKIQWLVWGGLLLVIGGIVAAFALSKNKSSFPLRRPLPEFALTNQVGEKISRSDLLGQVWLADIFFTRCAGPCLRLSKQMSEMEKTLPPEVKLVSLTADPAYDTPEVLKKYGGKFNADPKRWLFLTGPKEEIYKLAMDGLLLAVEENKGKVKSIDEMFIHSTLFVLVDKQGQMRAFYESTEPQTKERILSDIQKLLAEK